jgi:hypothetical protein
MSLNINIPNFKVTNKILKYSSSLKLSTGTTEHEARNGLQQFIELSLTDPDPLLRGTSTSTSTTSKNSEKTLNFYCFETSL